jgi:hypothetical protein
VSLVRFLEVPLKNPVNVMFIGFFLFRVLNRVLIKKTATTYCNGLKYLFSP